MKHSLGASWVDFDCFGEVLDRQIVVTKVSIDQTPLYPHCLIIRQQIDHNAQLIECLIKVVHFLEHECSVEARLLECFVLVEGLVVTLNRSFDNREDFKLDA